MTFNKKEKLIFWNAALIAIVGGVIGNLWVGSFFNMFDREFNGLSIASFVIFSLIFIFAVIKVFNIVNEVSKIKRGRPKKK